MFDLGQCFSIADERTPGVGMWMTGREFVKDYNLAMPPRPPELRMSYDQNSIPVSAKCSLCGEQMPQSVPRIADPMDSVEWFAAQFRVHIARIHLEAWRGKSRVQ